MPRRDRSPQELADRLFDELREAGLDRALSEAQVVDLVQRRAPLLGSESAASVTDLIRRRFSGLGPLQELFSDPEVSEVMINGGVVWVERCGALERASLELDGEVVERLIEDVVSPLDRRVDRASPLVDGRLPDGSRVNIIIPPLAVDGPCITIRRFRPRRVTVEDFGAPHLAALLLEAVQHRANIIVSGGTGSGKTTLLNALAAAIGSGERVITIEDTTELELGLDHVIRLESREANAEGAGQVGIDRLVRNALRMRPDRILVGEVRGAEVVDMLQAMNTGHEGSLSTCHANSPRDALRRLEMMCLTGSASIPASVARSLVTTAVDLVVQVQRLSDGRREIVAVAELVGEEDWTEHGSLCSLVPGRAPQARWRRRLGPIQ